ncbi:hypothetical protein DL765_006241 [Monosporascus sp. GIB2]|nr:hypothetical protein DL765_006241 [Monosporascus sp. GIB2]
MSFLAGRISLSGWSHPEFLSTWGVVRERGLVRALWKCIPDGGAVPKESQRQGKSPVESSKRCGVVFDAASGQTSAPYPESKGEWGSLINILRLVTQSCEHLTPQQERSAAERARSRLQLEGGLERPKGAGEIPTEEFHYLYSDIDNEVANIDKANTEAGFKACEETQQEVFRRKTICESPAKEVKELEKTILNSEAARKRLSIALEEKEQTEELREQARHEAAKKIDEREALMARQKWAHLTNVGWHGPITPPSSGWAMSPSSISS